MNGSEYSFLIEKQSVFTLLNKNSFTSLRKLFYAYAYKIKTEMASISYSASLTT